MKIPVIINNRDLLTWPKAMVERIKKYDGVGEIWIVDNASTNLELLQWYDRLSGLDNINYIPILELSRNIGHTAPWDCGLVKKLNSPYYVVTDSDMGLEDTPDNTLLYLLEKEKEFKLGKVGLGLEWWRVPENSPYYNHMKRYEIPRWNSSRMENGVALDVAVDTTFALYSRDHYFICGGSTGMPYTARHLPWELTKEQYEENKEFKYYIEHASNSSSYKTFLGL